MEQIKRDTTRPYVLRPTSPIVVRITWLVALVFAMIAIAATSFWVGYGVAWRKTESVCENVIILKANAAELEDQVLRLRNMQALIAANFYMAGVDILTVINEVIPDTAICTLKVSTPVQAGTGEQ